MFEFEDQLELLVGWVWGKATDGHSSGKNPHEIFIFLLRNADAVGHRPFQPRIDFDDVLFDCPRRKPSCDVLHTTHHTKRPYLQLRIKLYHMEMIHARNVPRNFL